MFFPPIRRALVPALILLAIVVFYRSSTVLGTFHRLAARPTPGIRVSIVPFRHGSDIHLGPILHDHYSFGRKSNSTTTGGPLNGSSWQRPASNPYLAPLFNCPTPPNKHTNHIRLNNIIRNISLIPAVSLTAEDQRQFWNPSVISLPYWSQNQYLIVSRIVTDGQHHENVLCEANVCFVGSGVGRPVGEIPCTQDDIRVLGPAGGMRCVTEPTLLKVPPTPAAKCEGEFEIFADVPGFHDPRIFWSGKGEPLMMVNTQSQYFCYGLWVIDLRPLHRPLIDLLASSPMNPSLGPLMSYPSLTELTRNPAEVRLPIEKNWMFFFPGQESYLHYEISPRHGRSFAKLIGAGLTTNNLTDPLEIPCLTEDSVRSLGSGLGNATKMGSSGGGVWHQASNSLRLVLCERNDANCKPNDENTVFFAVAHQKYNNPLHLPLRYERYFIVWSAASPFAMLGVSRHPLLLANETATGWTAAQNREGDSNISDDGNLGKDQKGSSGWAEFTYTVSIAYAWGRGGDEAIWKNTGFLDDEVVLGIGIDDKGQGFASVKTRDLLQCLRACPGSR